MDLAIEPEHVARRLIDEGFTAGRLEIADELVADDMAEHQDLGPGHAEGPEGVKAVIRSLRTGFSDFSLVIEDIVVAGDTVWMRNRATGTHDGTFAGVPGSGRSIEVTVFDVLRVVDGKIVEHWGVPDRLQALIQIGGMRRPGPAPAV